MYNNLTTLFTGRQFFALTETDSTNTYLGELFHSRKLPEGTAVRSQNQKAGRGQAGATWESEPGKNLLVSFLFLPYFIHPRNLFRLNETFSLAVHDFVSEWLGENVTIKWPNDIYWKNKKIAGLLIENGITGNTISHTIIGMGINVNQEVFPATLPNAASFRTVTKRDFDLDELFTSLCLYLETRYLKLKSGARYLNEQYLEVLYGRGEWKTYATKEGRFTGSVQSVDESGKLIVLKENGEFSTFDLKEIKLIV